jgi:hypothetical protein
MPMDRNSWASNTGGWLNAHRPPLEGRSPAQAAEGMRRKPADLGHTKESGGPSQVDFRQVLRSETSASREWHYTRGNNACAGQAGPVRRVNTAERAEATRTSRAGTRSFATASRA